MSNISFLTALSMYTASLEVSTFRYLAQTTNNGTLGSFSNRTPTSLVLLHTTYTCAFKPGCLMSHYWLHTPDCKSKNEKTQHRREALSRIGRQVCDGVLSMTVKPVLAAFFEPYYMLAAAES